MEVRHMEMEARARELVRAYRKRKGLAWMRCV